jgi:glucan phosphoethanolaminetransferase (alkaline phosphatase superfamily)
MLAISEIDLLNLGRSCGQSISNDFAQIIAITFAMVVAIYYFLHQAGFRMKLFAFTIYTCGMLAFLGMMLLETNVAVGALEALRAIPEAAQSSPTQHYLSVRKSWVGLTSAVLLNLLYWILWAGTGYLLFFWRKPPEIDKP